MVLELECQQKLEELFCPTEERKEERSLAHSLSIKSQNFKSYQCLHSSKYFRLFHKPSNKTGLEISISRKFFKLAVDRNKIKRRVKEIFRVLSPTMPSSGIIVFSVFRPFAELSYGEAVQEVRSAVKSFKSGVI